MALTTRQSYLLGTTPPAKPTVAPAILRRAVMTQQPQVPVEIDWSNPLAKGISAAWANVGGHDAVSGGTSTLGTGSALVATPSGIGVKVSGTSNLNRCVLHPSLNADSIGSGDFTVVISFYLDADGGYSAIGRWNTGGSPATCDWFLGGNTLGAKINFSVACGGSAFSAELDEGIAFGYGVLNTLVGRRKGTTIYVDRYVNGVYATGSSTTNAGITTVNYNLARSLKIGEIDIGATYNAKLTANFASIHKRYLSDAECAALARQSKWQIFKAPNVTPWVGI